MLDTPFLNQILIHTKIIMVFFKPTSFMLKKSKQVLFLKHDLFYILMT
jgi:hypothetical protein